jgi:hypothetical protein
MFQINTKMTLRKNLRPAKFWLPVLIVLVLLAGFLFYRHLYHQKPITLSEYNKGEGTGTINVSPGSNSIAPSSETNNNSKDVGPSKTAGPDTPSGNFVSSHKVSLAAGGNIASTCNTTPGANCSIIFSNGTITKALPARMADAGGAAYWNWQVSDLGLTVGTWQIKASASLNGQEAESSDALDLVVKD